MEIFIPDIIKDNTIIYGVSLTLALIGVAFKTAIGLIDLYEEVIIKRYFKRLDSLTNHTNKDSASFKYINALKESEVFRLASGIEASPVKANMLMDIYLSGVVNNSELKRISPYLKPKDSKVLLDVSKTDKFLFAYSFIAALILLLLGVLMGFSYFAFEKGAESFFGLFYLIFFILLAAIVGRDYRTLLILKRTKDQLINLDRVDNPDAIIHWSFARSPREPKSKLETNV